MSTEVATTPKQSLVAKFASRFSIEPEKLMTVLKATAFKVEGGEVSNEQMAALLVVADQYGLNPFTRELFAFPDKRNGIVPVVSVDGWCRIINDHPQFDGVEFTYADDAVTCAIFRKDRAHAVVITEFMAECKRGTQPWSSHPKRMLRHKALIQCARVAFGFSGIYDEDEAQRIVEVQGERIIDQEPPKSRTEQIKERLRKPAPTSPEQSATSKTSPSPSSSSDEGDGQTASRQETGHGPTLQDCLALVWAGDYAQAQDFARGLTQIEQSAIENAIRQAELAGQA